MFRSLRLQNYRSYRDQQFEFQPGVNIIIGANGSGKTNLLEALYVLSRGTSFRSDDASLIQHGRQWTRLEAQVGKDIIALKLQQDDQRLRKTLERNGKASNRHHAIAVVLFEPDQLRIVHGPPELRRGWLDSILSQLHLDYSDNLRKYQRALRQRNKLLHQGANKDDLFVWEIKLSEYGSKLAEARRQLVAQLGQKLERLYQQLAGSRDKVSLSYQTPFAKDYASQFMSELARRRSVDAVRGHTSVGPHRDDLLLTFGRQVVSDVASRGERRTLYLALKFLEAELLEEVLGAKPILLLDDLFGELDDRRKRQLQSALTEHQIIITSTDDHPIAGSLPTAKRVIKLEV